MIANLPNVANLVWRPRRVVCHGQNERRWRAGAAALAVRQAAALLQAATLLTTATAALATAAMADAAAEPGCWRSYPKVYLVADQSAGIAVIDLYVSDVCPGRLHRWGAVERLTADTITQVGVTALARIAPLCIALNTVCTGALGGDPDCVRVPPVVVSPVPGHSCPPPELPVAVAAPPTSATTLRVPGADADGNLMHCPAPAVAVDWSGRRSIAGIRLAGCSASLVHPGTAASHRFGGASLVFSDGAFDSKSFAVPHVVSRLIGSTDGAGRVVGLGVELDALLRRWTHAYRVAIDLPIQFPRVEP